MFDDNDDTPVTLTINKSYANKYQTWREKEEKQKCKKSFVFYFFGEKRYFSVLVIARYGSDVEDDSDEESEDENAEVNHLISIREFSFFSNAFSFQEWTDDVEKEFLRCYSILKQRDPKIYDPQTTFFNTATSSDNPPSTSSSKKKDKKKMNLKDAEIQYALASANNADEDNLDDPIP